MDAPTPETPKPVALWNPNAAALWSVIFTPVFGAYLHALNWRALGDSERETASMTWVYGGGLMLVLHLLIEVLATGHSADSVSQVIGFAFLLAWYFASGHAQAKLVKEKFGHSFPRKPWKQPLLMGLAGFGVYIALMVAIGVVIGLRNL